ncbi:unnamed protein product [Miscanthus lutarioriparius]|uniref:Uncharacterized protein n=1 Tax=Miscanthus lutarioriparius TaxID=422564 RepID=A0A811PYI2_9POAL|nr:unnamed protein product [Miscanthus lutarioriparius]
MEGGSVAVGAGDLMGGATGAEGDVQWRNGGKLEEVAVLGCGHRIMAAEVSYCLGFIIVCKRAIVLDEMKSTVFSAVVVSIGYALLGWDFAALLEANHHMEKEFELLNGPSIEESPRWLASDGKISEARVSLQWLRGKKHDVSEHEHMNEHRDGNSDQQTRVAYSAGEVNNGDGLRASLLSQAANVESTGISGLLRCAPEILEQVGVSLFSDIGHSPHSTSILISTLHALLILPCITAAMLLMDVCGRRVLVLATTPILILSLSVMSMSTLVNMGSFERTILFHFALTICFCSYVVGLGPIPNLLCSEIFPTKARATCVSFCSLSFWFGGLLSAYCFPVMMSTIGLGGACGIYALVCCAPLFLFYYRIPETKMLNLELIAELFKLSRQEYVH